MEGSRLVRKAEGYLEARGIASPHAEAEALVMHALGTDRTELYSERAIGLGAAARIARALCRRCEGVPLQHLTGEQPFLDLTLAVRAGVFIPRPETETVVERALEILEGIEGPVVVDVGTGTGAIALSIKRARPDARVLATDRSPAAIALAGENAARHGLEIELLPGDLLAPLPEELRGRLSLIVSNPPYVTEEEYAALPREVLADPREALLGGVEVHRRLAEEAPRWLRPGGRLVMEIGETQGAEVRALLEGGFADVRILPDLAGRDRVALARHDG